MDEYEWSNVMIDLYEKWHILKIIFLFDMYFSLMIVRTHFLKEDVLVLVSI